MSEDLRARHITGRISPIILTGAALFASERTRFSEIVRERVIQDVLQPQDASRKIAFPHSHCERTYFAFPTSNALCEICYHPMRERTIRVRFDLDERCTLVKYSLLRSIFWKDAIFFSARKSEGKKRKEGDILFPCYPRVARSLKSARLYAENMSSLKMFFSFCSRRFSRLPRRRTSPIMRLLHDVSSLLSLYTDYL